MAAGNAVEWEAGQNKGEQLLPKIHNVRDMQTMELLFDPLLYIVCNLIPALNRIFQEEVVVEVEEQQYSQRKHHHRCQWIGLRVEHSKVYDEQLHKDHHHQHDQMDEPLVLEALDHVKVFLQQFLAWRG